MRLLREPLVHFTLAGGLLFAAHGWLASERAPGDADRPVRIGDREVGWLVETWTRQRQRPPSNDELQGLVTDYLKEELLAREARELELDRDDTVVRRRLAQKMEFLVEDTTAREDPTEAELAALYREKRGSYATPALSSFEQVLFSSDARGARAEGDARQALAALERVPAVDPRERGLALDPRNLGDRSLLPFEMVDADEVAVTSQFGRELAAALVSLEPGRWSGPIVSSFGLHLVRLKSRTEGRPRSFEETRETLVAEWHRERDARAREAYFADLFRKYRVEVAGSVAPLLGSSVVALRGEAR